MRQQATSSGGFETVFSSRLHNGQMCSYGGNLIRIGDGKRRLREQGLKRVVNTTIDSTAGEVHSQLLSSLQCEEANLDLENVPADVSRAYQAIADDPSYKHFVHIPNRIIRCIDYFGIGCDRLLTRARLQAYYLFIGVVDDAIDSGQIGTGRLVLDYLSTPLPLFDEAVCRSRVKLITEILKSQACDETYSVMVGKLQELYEEVVRERAATSIDSYIEQRKSVGALTAELSYVLVRPALLPEGGDHQALCRFMKEVGAIGCLVDSLIDLRADRRLGLLGFKPRISDYAKLIVDILRDGLRVSLKHPGLAGLFLQAIGDNVQDRFRAGRSFAQPAFVSDRKAEPASVA
jgi:hypothetical protein